MKGVFIEGRPVYEGSRFYEKTQISWRSRTPTASSGCSVFCTPSFDRSTAHDQDRISYQGLFYGRRITGLKNRTVLLCKKTQTALAKRSSGNTYFFAREDFLTIARRLEPELRFLSTTLSI
jgi:hypothetical protein